MYTQQKESQAAMLPSLALDILRLGNERFHNNLKANRDLIRQVHETSDGQWPFAAILSCIDSRTSAELIFDLGIGDAFSIRIAGNLVNDDILGSLEFAAKVAGARLVLVLGHSRCGAIKGACDDVRLGNLTGLIEKLAPAVQATEAPADRRTRANGEFVDLVARRNVHHSLEQIRQRSPVLRELEEEGTIGLVGAMYDVQSGKVEFFPSDSRALRPKSPDA